MVQNEDDIYSNASQNADFQLQNETRDEGGHAGDQVSFC